MKNSKYTLIMAILLFANYAQSQNVETRQLKSFSKIIVSPLIDLVLVAGDEESVKLESNSTNLNKVNTNISGRTLRIFLDDARITVKRGRYIRSDQPDVIFRRSSYEGVKVKAYVTYKELNNLQVRGNAEIVANGRIVTDKLKIKLYGDNKANIEYLDTDRLKVALYGANYVKIEGGGARKQIYKSFGDNSFNALSIPGDYVRTSLYGDNKLKLNVDERLRISSLGESDIYVKGKPRLQRRIILGDFDIRRIR